MIQLRPDCLIFKTTGGEQFPCSAEGVTLELLGGLAQEVEPEVVQNASAAVLHYFKHELNQNYVSIGDFAQALEKVFRSLGIGLEPLAPSGKISVVETSLEELAMRAGEGWELFFFPHLRDELKRKMAMAPHIVRFYGLRNCVKVLAGAPRWNRRCQILSHQIVEFLRTCWSVESGKQGRALVVL